MRRIFRGLNDAELFEGPPRPEPHTTVENQPCLTLPLA